MAKKKKSKFKKILKTLGKVAALGGAAYGASKLFGGSQGTPLGIAGGGVDAIVRRKAKRDAGIDAGIGAAEADKGSEMYVPKRKSPPVLDPHRFRWPMNLKKGGSVTGIAKRGFGRALMKGKK